MKGAMMKGWFFGIDEVGERFAVNLALVTTVTLSPKKKKERQILTFCGRGDETLYTVIGKRAPKRWDEFRALLAKQTNES